MLDVIQKAILAGVGATTTAKEQTESVLSELVSKGKITTEEAADLASRFIKTIEGDLDKSRADFEHALEAALVRANVASQTKLEALTERIAQLERRVGELEVDKPPTDPTA